MMPTTDKIPTAIPAEPSTEPSASHPVGILVPDSPHADDGTRALLQAGWWITLIALLALIATKFLFGGIGINGPHTNAGWLSFMFALMGLPFGLMLLVLGGAKWLRNRRLHARGLTG